MIIANFRAIDKVGNQVDGAPIAQNRGYALLMWIIFAFVGVLSGAIIAWALDMNSPKEIAQGAIGGLIAGILMSAMLPH